MANKKVTMLEISDSDNDSDSVEVPCGRIEKKDSHNTMSKIVEPGPLKALFQVSSFDDDSLLPTPAIVHPSHQSVTSAMVIKTVHLDNLHIFKLIQVCNF